MQTWTYKVPPWFGCAVLMVSCLNCYGIFATNIVETSGTDFIIGLIGQTSAGQTKLQIVSNGSTHVNIDAPFVGLANRLYLQQPSTHIMPLDSSLREVGSALSFKGIRVTSDNPIEIYVLDDVTQNVGGYMALPTNVLGIDYIVTSFESRDRSEILIISLKDRTRVSVHLKTLGQVYYRGNGYSNGEVIVQTLDTYQTWQLQSTSDMTGTVVKADGKVAVFSGGACVLYNHRSSNCGFLVEQMLPIETWQTTFIVPSIATDGNTIRVLARDDYTTVKFSFNKSAVTVDLNATTFFDKSIDFPGVTIVTSNRPISVSLVTGNHNSNNVKPSMALIPSISQFDSFYRFTFPDVTVHIIVPSYAENGILMNNQQVVPRSPVRVHVPGVNYNYTVFSVDVTGLLSQITLNHVNGITFGAVVFGIRKDDAFSFPLGMRLDLTSNRGKVRLIDGTSPTSGRVEYLYNGSWGTICGDSFDYHDANVVCRMIGFNFGAAQAKAYPNAKYGAGSGPILVDNLQCDGTETELHLCRSGPWGNTNCQHNKDAGVDCGTEIQLVGTNDPREGRLQVFYNEQWGTVCDDNFGHMEAGIVCKSLGYGNKGYFYTGGGGTGPQWIDDVHCVGEESDIAQCMVKRWGVTDCTHDEDVWVACYPKTKLRLAGGSSPAEGRLEVYVAGHWASVCDNMFDNREAVVVCRMLGYELDPRSARVHQSSQYGHGSGRMAIDQLQCIGSENDLFDCPYKPWMVTNCTHKQEVAVVCGSGIRLVNGTSPNNGRLEVLYNGSWGTVCDDLFGEPDAQVVCRQLGYRYGLGPNSVKWYGSGTGPIVIDDLQCNGTENDVDFCKSLPWMQHNCGHGEDVGVDCGTAIRLVGGTSKSEGRVEVYHDGQWGTVCDNQFDTRDADVICNSLGFKYNMARKVLGGAYFGHGTGPIVVSELQCAGHEKDLQFCISDDWGSTSCSHAEDVGVDCGLSLDHAITGICNTRNWDIRVDLNVLKRLYPTAIPDDIELGLQGCKGNKQGNIIHFTQALNSCGTNRKDVGNLIVYTNEIKYAYHDPAKPNIVRNYNWTMTFICNVRTDGSVDFHSIVPTVTPQNTLAPGTAVSYHVVQQFYTDVGMTNPISGDPLQLSVGDMVYVKLYTTDADRNTKMVIQNCTASSTQDPRNAGNNRVVLLENGCPRDSSLRVLRTNNHDTQLSFRMFNFSPVKELFIQCDEKFCPISDYSPESLSNAECPDGWVTNSDSCYLFDHSDLTFKEAEALCTQEGSHLVEVQTSEEHSFLKYFAGFLKPTTYWIGLSDERIEKTWEWMTSNAIANFTVWYKNHPVTSRTKNCAVMFSGYDFSWYDTVCTHVHPAVCERSRFYEPGPGLVG